MTQTKHTAQDDKPGSKTSSAKPGRDKEQTTPDSNEKTNLDIMASSATANTMVDQANTNSQAKHNTV